MVIAFIQHTAQHDEEPEEVLRTLRVAPQGPIGSELREAAEQLAIQVSLKAAKAKAAAEEDDKNRLEDVLARTSIFKLTRPADNTTLHPATLHLFSKQNGEGQD